MIVQRFFKLNYLLFLFVNVSNGYSLSVLKYKRIDRQQNVSYSRLKIQYPNLSQEILGKELKFDTFYLSEFGKIVFINHLKKRFMEFSKQEITLFRKRERDKKIGNMSKKNRALAHTVMTTNASTAVRYRKLGTKKIGNLLCQRFKIFKKGVLQAETCVVEPEKLDLDKINFETLRSFMELTSFGSQEKKKLKVMTGVNYNPFFLDWKALEKAWGKSGVPIHHKNYEHGKLKLILQLMEFKKLENNQIRFVQPEGYRLQAIPS